MTENLKRSLLARKQPTAAPHFNTEDSDETDIDTNIDLFDNSQRWSRKRKAVIESDEEISQSIVGGAGNSEVLAESGPIRYTVLDQRTANAIKELPSVLLQIKNTLEAIQNQSISSSPSVTSDDTEMVTQPQTVALGESDVKVAKKLYDRLNTSRVSLFVQDLATLVFGKECLGRSTLTGKSGKEQLDPLKVNAVTGFMWVVAKCITTCPNGFILHGRDCIDQNECEYPEVHCGKYAKCFNTMGSYYCQCLAGYQRIRGSVNFTDDGQCQDINECTDHVNMCGPASRCFNTFGSYHCTCRGGYIKDTSVSGQGKCVAKQTSSPLGKITTLPPTQLTSECDEHCGKYAKCFNTNGSYYCQCLAGYQSIRGSVNFTDDGQCVDINECEILDRSICGVGTCKNVDGSYWCRCPEGYTNYGNARIPCSELDCDSFIAPGTSSSPLSSLAAMMKTSCLALSTPTATDEGKTDGEALLEKLFTATESILSPVQPYASGEVDVTDLLHTVEDSIRFIGPQLKNSSTRIGTTETDAEITAQKGETRPTGPVSLTLENARLDTDWETASGTGPYPGFAMAALLSYKNLDKSFDELRVQEKDNASFHINSKVVSVVVSNPATQNLSLPVYITLTHVKASEESEGLKYMCAYWNDSGAWATDGCSRQEASNATHTVCRCEHLSSFAVLMALYPMEHTFRLQLVTRIGLVISLLCLVMSIFTFAFCHSIKGTRTAIHLHLCICLFVADLVFLAGISQTTPVGGCRFVAALLHYSFLGVFTWMLLEGVQLYRMVVLVFNATMRPLYLYMFGYGVPLGIVIISVIIRPTGYGTEQYCWLSLKDGLIWSFFGPVCVIIVMNVLFFIITVWKLALKFASLNPDLSKLHKIRRFTVTAIAQMCILGLMWVFGAFLFEGVANSALAYIFTILNSLQGALVFVMHCLLSKQVRDEYARFFSCICAPVKKRYSDLLSSTNPSSSQSQSQGSRSGQNTGESQI